MLSTEKMHNLEAEGYVLFNGLSEVFKPGRQDSQITLRDCSEEARGGARIYSSFCNKYQVVGTSKVYC